MRLRALELQGFKSFPDKTLLHFDASISAVVGPNGSGKSNLSDAIRWVLGEQSTRALRGGKMEDVIFGGTKQRKRVGFAEVTLTLDNEDGTLPTAEPEVAVTRRYYRSGESEYAINRRLVRLRDVNELFMDTGLGQEGYSLIGQGRIDEILSLKGTQRREVLEEAAGISRYRHRKEEAERKLWRTRENLVRIRDKLEELDLQRKPLAEQAQRATAYLQVQEELRRWEVSLWMQRLAKLREDNQDAQEAETLVRLEAEQAESRRLYARSESLRQEMQEKDRQLEQLRREETRREESAAACLQQRSVLQVQRENVHARLQTLTQETETRRARMEALQARLLEQQASLQVVQQDAQAFHAVLCEQEQERKTKDAQVQDAQESLAALQARGAEETRLAQEAYRRLSVLQASAQEIATREEALRLEQAALETRGQTARTQQLEDERTLLALSAQRREQSAQRQACIEALQAAQEQEQAAQDAWVSFRMEENALAARLRLLEDMQSLYEGYAGAVKTVMEQVERGALHGIHGPVASLLQVSERYALAVEIALGGAAQHLVVETERDGKALLGDLRRRDAGRVTCLPLDAVRGVCLDARPFADLPGYLGLAAERVQMEARYKGILHQLLGRVLLATDLDAGLRMAKHLGYRYRIVTLDGQSLAPGGAMTGGSGSKRGGIITRATELDGLHEKQQALRLHSREAEAALDAAKAQVHRAAQAAQQSQEEEAALKQQHALLRAQRQTQAEQQQTLAEQRGRYEAERNALRRRKEETAQQLQQAQADREQWEHAALQWEQECRMAEQCLQQARQTREQVLERLRSQQTQEAVRVAQQRASEQAIQDLVQQGDTLAQDADKQAHEQRALSDALLQLQADCTEQEQNGQRLQQQKLALDEALRQCVAEKLALEAERAQTDRMEREKNEALLHSQREAVLLEQKKLNAEQEEVRLLAQLWEQYELSHEGARAIAQPLDDSAEVERRVTALRAQLRAFGAVNVGAVEEYERVCERFHYLDTQKQDVEDADRQLSAVIKDLTGQMRDLFRREFLRINEAFGETFSALFGGGSAHLRLEDERDILQCGIEIHVSPPGKSLRSLSLLSGGEKALCAIAIYFAILKIRPTPFCVLDEIEAALDDANVLRFAHYLRSMATETQFIVISHRRGTMEEADLLYGVTMEQQGVSRLLRLRLGDEDAPLVAEVT